jgi:hypothetical protein
MVALQDFAAFLAHHGRLEEAIEQLSDWADSTGALLGDDHDSTLLVLGDLIPLLMEAGRQEDARAIARRILGTRVRRTGRSDATVRDYDALARLLTECEVASVRDPDRALAMARKAVELGGEADVTSLETLAWSLHLGNQHEDAAQTQRKALACLTRRDSESRVEVEDDLIRILLRGDDVTGATALFEEREGRMRTRIGDDHHRRGEALAQDAELLAEEGRFAMAETRARRALEYLRLRSPRDPLPARAEASALLGHCLARQGRFEGAEPLLVEEGYDVLAGNLLVEPQLLGKVRTWVADLYERWDRPADAARYRR